VKRPAEQAEWYRRRAYDRQHLANQRSRDPDDAAALRRLAVEDLDAAIALVPKSWEAYLLRAELHCPAACGEKELAVAIADLERCAANGRPSYARWRIGELWRANGRLAQAREAYEQSIRASEPDDDSSKQARESLQALGR
jgi:tetratricopeptide (TPR) repeat protein